MPTNLLSYLQVLESADPRAALTALSKPLNAAINQKTLTHCTHLHDPQRDHLKQLGTAYPYVGKRLTASSKNLLTHLAVTNFTGPHWPLDLLPRTVLKYQPNSFIHMFQQPEGGCTKCLPIHLSCSGSPFAQAPLLTCSCGQQWDLFGRHCIDCKQHARHLVCKRSIKASIKLTPPNSETILTSLPSQAKNDITHYESRTYEDVSECIARQTKGTFRVFIISSRKVEQSCRATLTPCYQCD